MEEIIFGKKIREERDRKNSIGVLNYTDRWDREGREVGDKPVKRGKGNGNLKVTSVGKLAGEEIVVEWGGRRRRVTLSMRMPPGPDDADNNERCEARDWEAGVGVGDEEREGGE